MSSPTRVRPLLSSLMLGIALLYGRASVAQQTPAAAPAAARPAGTVLTVSGNAVVLKTDAGATLQVHIADGARILRAAPGATSAKEMESIQLTDIQPNDRMVVMRGASASVDSYDATAVLVRSQGDVAKQQQQDLQQWQRNGAGGIVGSADATSGAIVVKTTPNNTATIKTSPSTQFLRYSPSSIKFSDATKSSFDKITPGDQLRAKGKKSADGKEITADTVISGSFKNIAGTVDLIDAASNTVVIKDLLSKKAVTLHVTPDSQLKQLPQPVALHIAMMLRGGAAGAGGAQRPNAPTPSAPQAAGVGMQGRSGMGGAPDLQQVLNRMPSTTLADLKKGDAVIAVATPGTDGSGINAINLISGVEPILTAAPSGSGAASFLSSWNMSAPAGDIGGGGPQ